MVVKFNCKVCGVAVERNLPPSKRFRAKTCSVACSLEGLRRLAKDRVGPLHQNWRGRVERVCASCGSAVFVYPRDANKSGRSFCSSACRDRWLGAWIRSLGYGEHPAWRGGHRYYRGPNWSDAKKLVLERDGGCCVGCGKKAESVHHRRPYFLFEAWKDANALENLEARCRSCHSIVEHAFWETATSEELAKCRATCKRCGGSFQPRQPMTPNWFCDSCLTKRTCEWCSSSFVVDGKPRKSPRARFCSKSCLGKWVFSLYGFGRKSR